jgi:hypothetical protein
VDQLRHLVVADHHGAGGAAVGDHVERDAGQDQAGGLGHAAFHGLQGFRRDRGVVVDPALEQCDAGQGIDLAELVLDHLVAGQDDESDGGAGIDPIVEVEGHVAPVDGKLAPGLRNGCVGHAIFSILVSPECPAPS